MWSAPCDAATVSDEIEKKVGSDGDGDETDVGAALALPEMMGVALAKLDEGNGEVDDDDEGMVLLVVLLLLAKVKPTLWSTQAASPRRRFFLLAYELLVRGDRPSMLEVELPRGATTLDVLGPSGVVGEAVRSVLAAPERFGELE